MRAGKLRHRVDFEEPGLVQDESTGEMIPGWAKVWQKVPASFEPLSTRDLLAAQASQSEASARIVIRYRAGILPTMRVIHRGQVYAMEGVPLADPVSGLDYLTVLLSAGVNDG